jgi:predicted nucleic acid-binding protein
VIFADTFFYLALLRNDDPAHAHALAAARRNRRILTTKFVLLELGNACARAEDHADFLALIEGIRATARITAVTLGSRLMERGLQRMGSGRTRIGHGRTASPSS